MWKSRREFIGIWLNEGVEIVLGIEMGMEMGKRYVWNRFMYGLVLWDNSRVGGVVVEGVGKVGGVEDVKEVGGD